MSSCTVKSWSTGAIAALLLAASTSSPSVAWSGRVAITLHITSRSDSAQAESADSDLGASAVASSDCVMGIASILAPGRRGARRLEHHR